MLSVKTDCANCLPRVTRRMCCAGSRHNARRRNGRGCGRCIASRPIAKSAACWLRRATPWRRASSRPSTGSRVSWPASGSRSSPSPWWKARSARTAWRKPSSTRTALACLAALVSSPTMGEGFVLAMAADGQLAAQAPQAGFAQSYVAGRPVGAAGLIVFGEDAGVRRTPAAQSAPAPATPHPEILTALHDTALRYAGHPALRAAGLTASDWLALFQANIEVESAYRPSAVSSAGAIGLGQLMPETARDPGVDPQDPAQNLDGAAHYLAMMLDTFRDPRLALAAYNAGP